MKDFKFFRGINHNIDLTLLPAAPLVGNEVVSVPYLTVIDGDDFRNYVFIWLRRFQDGVRFNGTMSNFIIHYRRYHPDQIIKIFTITNEDDYVYS